MTTLSERFSTDWAAITSLKLLAPDALHRFWEQVDDFIAHVESELPKQDPLDEFVKELNPPLKQMMRLGDLIRMGYILRLVHEKADPVRDRMAFIRSSFMLGYIRFSQHNLKESEDYYRAGIAHLDSSPAHQILKTIQLSNLGMVTWYMKEMDRSIAHGTEALRLLNGLRNRMGIREIDRISQQLGVPSFTSQISAKYSNLGAIYHSMVMDSPPGSARDSLLTRAIRYNVRSLQYATDFEDRIRSQANLALSLIQRNEFERADRMLETLDRQCQRDIHARLLSWINGFRADLALKKGDPEKALRFCHQSMKLAIQAADPVSEGQIILLAMEPLKQISTETFKGSLNSASFQENGLPIIHEILDFLEDKDWYTARDHSHGVRRITTSMYDVVREQYPEAPLKQQRLTIEMAALVHDIGKLWIPWTILNRTTPLMDEEFEIIRTHPEKGRLFLEELGFPLIGDLLGRHHERPDGRGYPHGDDIGGIAERILAVADSFEAMTTPNRAYREPLSKETAVRRIMELADAQFDAFVVRSLPAAIHL